MDVAIAQLKYILANPDDRLARAVYADILEESGNIEIAKLWRWFSKVRHTKCYWPYGIKLKFNGWGWSKKNFPPLLRKHMLEQHWKDHVVYKTQKEADIVVVQLVMAVECKIKAGLA